MSDKEILKRKLIQKILKWNRMYPNSRGDYSWVLRDDDIKIDIDDIKRLKKHLNRYYLIRSVFSDFVYRVSADTDKHSYHYKKVDYYDLYKSLACELIPVSKIKEILFPLLFTNKHEEISAWIKDYKGALNKISYWSNCVAKMSGEIKKRKLLK